MVARVAVDFWELDLLIGIALEAGNWVTPDDFTTKYWKTGFAWVKKKLDSSETLKPGVSIRCQNGVFS